MTLQKYNINEQEYTLFKTVNYTVVCDIFNEEKWETVNSTTNINNCLDL